MLTPKTLSRVENIDDKKPWRPPFCASPLLMSVLATAESSIVFVCCWFLWTFMLFNKWSCYRCRISTTSISIIKNRTSRFSPCLALPNFPLPTGCLIKCFWRFWRYWLLFEVLHYFRKVHTNCLVNNLFIILLIFGPCWLIVFSLLGLFWWF